MWTAWPQPAGCYDDPYISWVRAQNPEAVRLCRVDTPPAWPGPAISDHPRRTDQPYAFEGPEELTHSAFVADLTCDYLRSRASRAREGEPFFAIAGFYAPHAPLNPPRRYLEAHDVEAMPLPARSAGQNFLDPDTGAPVTDAQWRVVRQYYNALVTHVDECVGRILTTLNELGLTEDTLVVFTSDHGENLGDHGLIGKSHWFDSSTRVPLIVKPPVRYGAPGGMRDERIVELVDLAPTIAEVCGVPAPPAFQGQSLGPWIREGTPATGPERKSALIEHGFPGGAGFKAIRTSQYLYVRHRDATEQLYDLATDPDQVTDVLTSPASSHTRVRDQLGEARGELLHRLLAAEPPFPRPTAAY